MFADKIGGFKHTTDVDAFIGVGRGVLREKLSQANVDITGVNFAVAVTGSFADKIAECTDIAVDSADRT